MTSRTTLTYQAISLVYAPDFSLYFFSRLQKANIGGRFLQGQQISFYYKEIARLRL